MVKGSLLLAVSSSFVFACTVGAPAGQDLFTDSSDATPTPKPTPTQTPAPLPPPCSDDDGCSASEEAYGTVTECTSAGSQRCRLVSPRCGGSAYYCGTAASHCNAVPTCQPGEVEVPTCNSGAKCTVRTECGRSIICQKQLSNCDAYPTCDPGDIETKDLDECNQPKVDCYSRTVCGSTITCINVN